MKRPTREEQDEAIDRAMAAMIAHYIQRFVRKSICWAFDHKITANDSGYDFCDRCGKHAFHDGETWHKSGRLRLDYWFYATRHWVNWKVRLIRNRFKKPDTSWDDIPF
jgi:hypothetical protein